MAGVSALQTDASLYELGADSLTLLDLIDELQAATGVVFQLSQFSHKVSPPRCWRWCRRQGPERLRTKINGPMQYGSISGMRALGASACI